MGLTPLDEVDAPRSRLIPRARARKGRAKLGPFRAVKLFLIFSLRLSEGRGEYLGRPEVWPERRGDLDRAVGESSGFVRATISTLSNWCCRMMPRVSRPAAPASARKHDVKAVYRSGRESAARISSRWSPVSGTSAVGMRYSPSRVRKRSV